MLLLTHLFISFYSSALLPSMVVFAHATTLQCPKYFSSRWILVMPFMNYIRTIAHENKGSFLIVTLPLYLVLLHIFDFFPCTHLCSHTVSRVWNWFYTCISFVPHFCPTSLSVEQWRPCTSKWLASNKNMIDSKRTQQIRLPGEIQDYVGSCHMLRQWNS